MNTQIKNIMYRFVFMVALSLPLTAAAQSLSEHNFAWVSEQNHDLVFDTIRVSHVTFKSYGLEKFEMVQRSAVLPFLVISTEGTWNDISNEGQLTVSVTLNGQPGIITVGRGSEGIYLQLNMTPSNPEGVNRKFFISSLTVNE